MALNSQRRVRARSYCTACGRRIVVFYRGRAFIPRDDDHDLCQQCWKGERDRARADALVLDGEG